MNHLMTREWYLFRSAVILAVLVALATVVGAQTSPPGNLTVRSNPPGADVRVDGEASAAGITPVTFNYPLIGPYDLRISKYGYETYKTRMALDPAKEMVVDIRLSPKTRFKAAARSVFIPGWGQRYAEQKTKGFFLHLLAAGSVTAFLITDHDFNTKFDRFDVLRAEYDSAKATESNEKMQIRYNLLYDAQKRAYDAENARRISIGSLIAVWGLGVLDALLFTPEERASFSVKGIAFEPQAGPGVVGLRLSKSF
jgi:hypothetical protein